VAPLPKVVFEHYRNPRNEGDLPDADVVGAVEGRREDSQLRLYLRIAADRVAAARFRAIGDRSCAVGLSLVTTLIEGLPVGEVRALTVEAVARAYDLHAEQRPMLVAPLEALDDALCAWAGEPSPYRREGPLVCHCLHVREGRIVRAIRGRRLRTVPDVQFWTRACTGCRSCRQDVEALLRREGG